MNRPPRPRPLLRAIAGAAIVLGMVTGAARADDPSWTARPALVADLGAWGGEYGYASLDAISCATASDCTAVGTYLSADPAGDWPAFSQSSSGGIWQESTAATFAPGVEATPRDARFLAVSCPTAGDCMAVGKFRGADGGTRAFVQRRSHGSWSTAEPLPLPAGDYDAQLTSVACTSAGTCTAVGRTGDRALRASWSDGVLVEATAATVGAAERTVYTAVSCPAPDACTAAGWYQDPYAHAFTQSASDGVWQEATAATFAGGEAGESRFESISCPSAGDCVAVGHYQGRPIAQRSSWRVWSTVTEFVLPRTFTGGILGSVSCSAPGTCLATGYLQDTWYEAVTVASSEGTWGQLLPARIPAGEASTTEPNSMFFGSSCAPSGACVGVGYYRDAGGHFQPFAQGWAHGVRGDATTFSFPVVRGTGSSDRLTAVSCPASGDCSAAGQFQAASPARVLAFTASGPNGTADLPRVSVAPFGDGVGSVTSGDGRVACAWFDGTRSGACDDTTAGSVVLNAEPGNGSAFVGWTGACSGPGPCVLQGRDALVAAEFRRLPDLHVAPSGNGTGTVTSRDGALACTWNGTSSGGTCVDVTSATSVTLDASAGTGSTFGGWSGGGCSGTGACTVAMSASTTVTATFVGAVTANRLATKLEYTGSPRAGARTSFTLSAQLRTVPGTALPGQSVSFLVCDGRAAITATTNRKGVASATAIAPATKGTCQVRVRFAGAATYLPSEVTGTVKVL